MGGRKEEGEGRRAWQGRASQGRGGEIAVTAGAPAPKRPADGCLIMGDLDRAFRTDPADVEAGMGGILLYVFIY